MMHVPQIKHWFHPSIMYRKPGNTYCYVLESSNHFQVLRKLTNSICNMMMFIMFLTDRSFVDLLFRSCILRDRVKHRLL